MAWDTKLLFQPPANNSDSQTCTTLQDSNWVCESQAKRQMQLSLIVRAFQQSLASSLARHRWPHPPIQLIGTGLLPWRSGDFPKVGATLLWGPYTKDPTISGTILESPIFGNSHHGARKDKQKTLTPEAWLPSFSFPHPTQHRSQA